MEYLVTMCDPQLITELLTQYKLHYIPPQDYPSYYYLIHKLKHLGVSMLFYKYLPFFWLIRNELIDNRFNNGLLQSR